MMLPFAVLLLLFLCQPLSISGQSDYYCGPPIVNKTVDACPPGWFKYEATCYYINQYPLMNYADAVNDCRTKFGLLLRIDTKAQFEFIAQMMDDNTYDKSQPFYTAGKLDPALRFKFVWENHPASVSAWRTEIYDYWLEPIPREGDGVAPESWGDRIMALLGNDGAKWGFYLNNATMLRPFICQADAATLTASVGSQRGFDYGVVGLANVRRSPCIQQEPANQVYFENTRIGSSSLPPTAVFECLAYGNPQPVYSWYRFDTSMNKLKIDPLTQAQYSVTNGKLTINQVVSSRDSGNYACEATNEIGSVISRHAALKFGILPTFPKSTSETIVRNAFQFANMECKLSDNSNPRDMFSFQFFFSYTAPETSGDIREVRPDFRSNLFVSQSTGRLYFSEVSMVDAGYYYCQVGVTVGVATQEKGPNIILQVNAGGGDETSVMVADGYPSNVPKSPLRGNEVRLECIGYGPITRYNQPLIYSWRRTGKLQIPSKARQGDIYNRVLVIPNAQIEDSGGYECQIEDGNRRTSGWKRLELTINSGPFFVRRPFDLFVDEGTTQRFNCKAGGTPALSYSWFRGNNLKTELLDNIPDLDRTRFKWNVTGNLPFLEISNVVAGDAAEYGCRVSNSYDTIYGFAELRVLSFAPSFYKNPSTFESGLVGKSVYLPCDVEGAPDPVRTWSFNGATIAVIKVIDQPNRQCPASAKYCLLPSGKLQIQTLSTADNGDYSCLATNSGGSANNTVKLTVAEQLTFDFSPENRLVLVGSTVDLPCQLKATAANLDVNYAWRFEGTEILFGRYDFDARRYEETQFYRPYKKDFGTLRISNIQYDYEGNYTCQAQTPLGYEERYAYLRVAGPPGPCAGVDVPSINSTVFTISWRAGTDHQSPILGYQLELELSLRPGVWVFHSVVPESPDIIVLESGLDMGKRRAPVTGLPFFQQYRIRVSAVNAYGTGLPSPPSPVFVTVSGPPSQLPQNVTGGGGKIKTLVVRWRKIPLAYQGGSNFTYDVQYRKLLDTDWLEASRIVGKPMLIPPEHVEAAIVLSGTVDDVSFQQYEVRVRGASVRVDIVNGVSTMVRLPGDWTQSIVVRSAEKVPVSSPVNIRVTPFNATAVDVYWDPPLNYDGILGDILGYRVVYWPRMVASCNVENNQYKVTLAQRQTTYGKGTYGQVIGLNADTFYCFSVQLYNSAGDSPESSWRDVSTNKLWPSDLPTNIVVNSTGEYSCVSVTWNGVRQQSNEESVDGYTVRIWVTGAPAVNFTDTDAGLSNQMKICSLSRDTRYDLRVYAYSSGGIGTYSSPMIQFMLIPKERCVPGATWEAPDIRYVFICSAGAVRASLAALTLAVLAPVLRLLHLF